VIKLAVAIVLAFGVGVFVGLGWSNYADNVEHWSGTR
jgi:hypothetical protein